MAGWVGEFVSEWVSDCLINFICLFYFIDLLFVVFLVF